MQMNALIDVRSILPSVRVPTLVLHRQNDALVPVEQGRQLAERIPTPRLSNILAPITPSGMATWERCLATSRNS